LVMRSLDIGGAHLNADIDELYILSPQVDGIPPPRSKTLKIDLRT
jgi:hypothetical protein